MTKASYFPHDCDAQHDPKIEKMIRKHGWASYGLFWAIVENLYRQGGGIEADFEQIAYTLRDEAARIQSVITGFDLFFIDRDGFVRSVAVDRRIEEMKARSRINSVNGSKGGKVKPCNENIAGAKQPLSEGQAGAKQPLSYKIKLNKTKNKENKISMPRTPTPIQRIVNAYKEAKGVGLEDKAWDRANFGRYSTAGKSLLECFGGWEKAAVYVLAKGSEFDGKKLDWTLETICRHAWDNRGRINGGAEEKVGPDTVSVVGMDAESPRQRVGVRTAGQLLATGPLGAQLAALPRVGDDAVLAGEDAGVGESSEVARLRREDIPDLEESPEGVGEQDG